MKRHRVTNSSSKSKSVAKRRKQSTRGSHDSAGEWIAKRALAALEDEKYRESLSWAMKGIKAYGNVVCVAIQMRLLAAPWGKWMPQVVIQRTQLTKIHDRQVLWMQISKRLAMDRNIALMICGWISTM
jgi:hypothetical protein